MKIPSLKTLTILSLATLGLAFPAHSASITFDFEDAKTSEFSPLKGKGSEGSQLEVSDEKAHDGKRSLKLNYQSAGGWIEFYPLQAKPVEFTGDKLYLSFWVYGTGKKDFASAGVRILDKRNETFQWTVPGFGEAIAGEGWREVKATIDLSKPQGHWGDNADGIIDAPFAWFGFGAGRSAETAANGTFYIDGLRLSDQPLPEIAAVPAVTAATATLTVAPVTPPGTGPAAELLKWVQPPGKPAVFKANLALRGNAQGHSLQWKIRDAFDSVLAQGQRTLKEGEADVTQDILLPNPPRGLLYASVSLRSPGDEVLKEAQSRLAIFEPRDKPVPFEPFHWGIAAHVGRNDGKDADAEITLMRLLGFSLARSDMTWSAIQPEANVWKWDKHDKIYASFEREKIVPAPVIGYGTKWATTGDANSKDWHQWNNTPPKPEAYAAFARAAVKRYGHLTHYWELWNEPDIDFWLGTAEQYAALVDATVPAIKAEQPNAIVMNGGFSETLRRPNFIPTYIKATKNLPDVLAVHSHMQFENLLRAETNTQKLLKETGLAGPKQPKIWLNEAGYSSWRNSPEREQAVQLVKKMAYSPAAGYSAYVWYDLRDDGTDDAEIEHNFGLVKRDYRPKASAVAANVLMNNLGGRRFAGRLPLEKNSFVLTYSGLGSTVLTAWRQSATKSALSVPLLLRAKSKTGPVKLSRQDIFGNQTPIEASNGAFFITLDGTPQYVVANREDTQFEPVGQDGMLLKFAPSVVLVSGEAGKLPIQVTNPFDAALTGSLSVGSGAAVAVQLAPNSNKTYELPVQTQAAPGTRQSLPIKFISATLPVPMVANTELQTAFAIPNGPQTLNITPGKSNIVSLFEATPMQELHFKGDSDLSATAKLWKSAEGIRVQIQVADQTHNPVAEPGQWWRGDSVQWAVALPDGRLWEWMGALLPDGPKMALNLAPDGSTGTPLPASIKRDGANTTYEWTIPATLPGNVKLPERFGFNFLVNDNDGAGRKGWMEWTPGIGMEKNPSTYMPVAVAGK